MPTTIFPIPINTPFFDKGITSISIAWQLYLKNMGDELLQANKILPGSDARFKYVQNANLILCNYYTTSPETDPVTITLPIKSTLAFEVNGVIYPPNTSSVTIPAGIGLAQFSYII